MTRRPVVRPGEKVPDSGIYESDKTHTRATMVRGEPAAPTPKKGEQWVQIVDTNKEKR